MAAELGADSQMYRDAMAVFDLHQGRSAHGIPAPYAKYWRPFRTNGNLYHITTQANLESIRRHGLLPRDPFPRPWAGMKAVYLADPTEPAYIDAQRHVVAHVRAKGGEPVLLKIHVPSQLYKSSDPSRSFQVISLDRIPPESIDFSQNSA